MYGQTNCWALPEGKYGAYRGLDGEVYVMTQRAALNMSYQVRARGWADAEEVLNRVAEKSLLFVSSQDHARFYT
jgi:hypothetical protein